MPMIRYRSSDRLANLLQEKDEDCNSYGTDKADVAIISANNSPNTTNNNIVKSPVGSSTINRTISSRTLAAATSCRNLAALATVTVATTIMKKSNSKTNIGTTNDSSSSSSNSGRSNVYAVRMLCVLCILAMLHIITDSDSTMMTYRALTTSSDLVTTIKQNMTPSSSSSSNSNDNESSLLLTIDIVSVGSITKPDYQMAQYETFRTHPNVRNFYGITELNDTDATCHTDLSYPQLQQIISYCKSSNYRKQQSSTSSLLRKLLYHPRNHTGWMCAQKRPIDGIHLALQQYKNNNNNHTSIPTYLFIIDDDTYLNMNSIITTLQQSPQNHSTTTMNQMDLHSKKKNTIPTIADVPRLVTGCRYNYPQREHFLFPYGGFGTILSRSVIHNLLRPIDCTAITETGSSNGNGNGDDGFVHSACWRLQQNLMGELQYFTNGMSLSELMYTYSRELSFTQIDAWTNGHGFCFHSDHALGYFFGYYHIAVPDDLLALAIQNVTMYDTLRYEYGYSNFNEETNECKNLKTRCSIKSNICHYIHPQQMHYLFRKESNIHEQ